MAPKITIASLQQLLADTANAHTKEVQDLREALRASEEELKQTKDRNEKLHQRGEQLRKRGLMLRRLLSEAREKIAEQTGYINRALEDDAVREIGPHREFPPVPVDRRPMRQGPQTYFGAEVEEPRDDHNGSGTMGIASANRRREHLLHWSEL